MIEIGSLVVPNELVFRTPMDWGVPKPYHKYPWIGRPVRRSDRGVVVAIIDGVFQPSYIIEIEPGRYGSALAHYLQVEDPRLLPLPDTDLSDLEKARALIKELSHDR